MSKILVLYYSTYGHIETMAQAVAEGAGATLIAIESSDIQPDAGRGGDRHAECVAHTR